MVSWEPNVCMCIYLYKKYLWAIIEYQFVSVGVLSVNLEDV